jgi:hypothetical protein
MRNRLCLVRGYSETLYQLGTLFNVEWDEGMITHTGFREGEGRSDRDQLETIIHMEGPKKKRRK